MIIFIISARVIHWFGLKVPAGYPFTMSFFTSSFIASSYSFPLVSENPAWLIPNPKMSQNERKNASFFIIILRVNGKTIQIFFLFSMKVIEWFEYIFYVDFLNAVLIFFGRLLFLFGFLKIFWHSSWESYNASSCKILFLYIIAWVYCYTWEIFLPTKGFGD